MKLGSRWFVGACPDCLNGLNFEIRNLMIGLETFVKPLQTLFFFDDSLLIFCDIII